MILTSKMQNYEEYLLNPMYCHDFNDYDYLLNRILHISLLFQKLWFFLFTNLQDNACFLATSKVDPICFGCRYELKG